MLLHEFYGQDDYQDRKSMVFKEQDGYLILMLEDKTIFMDTVAHSEVYAENCAENWVLGVI